LRFIEEQGGSIRISFQLGIDEINFRCHTVTFTVTQEILNHIPTPVLESRPPITVVDLHSA